jgi:hypothetical protein
MDAELEEKKADREERRKDNQIFLARMEAIFDDNRKERQRVYNQETAIHSLKDDRKEMTAYNEAKEKIEIDSGMMQSMEEHQDVSSEDVAVMPVKGLKKQSRGRKSTAGRRGEPKKLNRGNCGSRKKLAAARRKVSRHATVAWRKKETLQKKLFSNTLP